MAIHSDIPVDEIVSGSIEAHFLSRYSIMGRECPLLTDLGTLSVLVLLLDLFSFQSIFYSCP